MQVPTSRGHGGAYPAVLHKAGQAPVLCRCGCGWFLAWVLALFPWAHHCMVLGLYFPIVELEQTHEVLGTFIVSANLSGLIYKMGIMIPTFAVLWRLN